MCVCVCVYWLGRGFVSHFASVENDGSGIISGCEACHVSVLNYFITLKSNCPNRRWMSWFVATQSVCICLCVRTCVFVCKYVHVINQFDCIMKSELKHTRLLNLIYNIQQEDKAHLYGSLRHFFAFLVNSNVYRPRSPTLRWMLTSVVLLDSYTFFQLFTVWLSLHLTTKRFACVWTPKITNQNVASEPHWLYA